MSKAIDYDPEDKVLRISDVTISDPDVVDFFEHRATEAELTQVLRVGVLALQVAETSRDVDHIEQAVAELRHDFETHVDGFVDAIEEQLEANVALIEDELDPTTDGTPTNELKTDLEDRLHDLRSKIDQEIGRQSEYQRSTHKGDDFEDHMGQLIQDLAVGPFADVEHTGDHEGVLDDCKTGDYVITTEEGYRIVLEIKDWTGGLSKNRIKSELDEAIRNREADHGLLVSRNASAIPVTDIGWFHEFDPERSVVVLSQSADDELHPSFFKFAYNWARIRARQAQQDLAEDIDQGWVDEQLQRLTSDIEELQSLRDQAANIQSTATELESNLHDKEVELLDTLADIRKEVATS